MSLQTQTNAQLDTEKLNRDLWEQIILGVAHELNNPNSFVRMNAMTIKKLISMLAPCFDEYDEQHPDATFGKFNLSEIRARLNSVADGILEASVRIIAIADKLKDLSSFSLSEASEVNMVELLQNMINMHKFLVEQLAAVDFVYDPKKNYHLRGHTLQLDQALSIIFTNAGDALHEHHGADTKAKGKITITLEETNNSITIRFRDNGCGIDDEIKNKIFTPYFTTKPQGVGDGLGLPLCQSVVQRHGGKIVVDSVKGQGTEFVITLPRTG